MKKGCLQKYLCTYIFQKALLISKQNLRETGAQGFKTISS